MKAYVLQKGIFPAWAEEELERVKKFLASLPNPVIPGEVLSCHVVALLYSELPRNECPIKWELRNGHFSGGYQHSWLVHEVQDFRYPMTPRLILDIYPVAGFQPFIVDGSSSSPWFHLYSQSKAYTYVNSAKISSWKKEAADIRELMGAFND